MNFNPNHRELASFLKSAVTISKIISISVYLTTFLAEVIFQSALRMRGKSTSDIGVPSYENSGAALLFWIIVFPTASFILAVLLKKTMDKNSYLSCLVVGIITTQFWLLRLLMLLF